MQEPTRRSVLAVLGAGFATAGCLSTDAPDRGTIDPTTHGPSDDTPSPDRNGDPETRTATGGGITHGANEPSADHDIALSNRSSTERNVRVRVTREAGDEVVFEETLAIAAGSERVVYNLERAESEGVEAFGVCGEFVDPGADETDTPAGDGTDGGSGTDDASGEDCATIETSECYGDVSVTVAADGTLRVIYAVC